MFVFRHASTFIHAMRVYTSIGIGVVAMLMLNACRKDGVAPYYNLPKEFSEYIVFPKGSYWVYEELATAKVDSIYQYRSDVVRKKAESKLGYNYDQYIAGYKSSLSSDSLRGFGFPDFNDQSFFVHEEFWLGDFLNMPRIFTSDPAVGKSVRYTENYSLEYEHFYDGFKVGGKVYHEVKVFHHPFNFFQGQSERIFFAKNVGIIRRELFNGEIWELKRHVINK
jgi:hypothetical protein